MKLNYIKSIIILVLVNFLSPAFVFSQEAKETAPRILIVYHNDVNFNQSYQIMSAEQYTTERKNAELERSVVSAALSAARSEWEEEKNTKAKEDLKKLLTPKGKQGNKGGGGGGNEELGAVRTTKRIPFPQLNINLKPETRIAYSSSSQEEIDKRFASLQESLQLKTSVKKENTNEDFNEAMGMFMSNLARLKGAAATEKPALRAAGGDKAKK